jgi:hypothetical protein
MAYTLLQIYFLIYIYTLEGLHTSVKFLSNMQKENHNSSKNFIENVVWYDLILRIADLK